MRPLLCTGFAFGALALAAAAIAAPPSHKPSAAAAAAQAPSAEAHGVAAAYRTPQAGHGYSAGARRRADCLASYPGYDWRTDRIQVRGVARPCPL